MVTCFEQVEEPCPAARRRRRKTPTESEPPMSEDQPVEDPPVGKHPSRIVAVLVAVVAVLGVVLGLGAAYAIGTNRATDDAAAPASDAGDPAQLGMVVSGTGSATGVPDQLRFTVTVHHSAADVTDAMNATSADTRQVVHALVARGVEKQDIRTAGVSVQPTYRYSGGQELISGYAASERVAVKVRDIKIAGQVISATATAAGNAVRIGGITMSVADPSSLEAQARAQAIADARTKAEDFAEAVGRGLGQVEVVEESEPTQDYSYQRGALDLLKADAAAAVPINPGTQTTKVYVQVRWSFA
jgi:uncharacterized protein YggE